jgi:membrane associated rhomboid family serine protease
MRMNDSYSPGGSQPVTWINGHPIYAAHFLALGFVGSMLVTTILSALNLHTVLFWLSFQSVGVLQGQVWRIFTYGLVNHPNLSFVFEMLMLVWFGHELEKFFGRRTFFVLYACLYLLSPVLGTALGPWRPSQFAGESASFALFIAFATLYPNVGLIFSILAKWIAWVLVGIYTLQAVGARDVFGLVTLWATTGFAFGFVSYQQGKLRFPSLAIPGWSSWRRSRSPRERRAIPGPRAATPADSADVDALLDKIALSGIHSLTPKERARLDAAREELRRRNQR